MTVKKFMKTTMSRDTFADPANPDLSHSFSYTDQGSITGLGLDMSQFPPWMQNTVRHASSAGVGGGEDARGAIGISATLSSAGCHFRYTFTCWCARYRISVVHGGELICAAKRWASAYIHKVLLTNMSVCCPPPAPPRASCRPRFDLHSLPIDACRSAGTW